jgi:hypothetical protein
VSAGTVPARGEFCSGTLLNELVSSSVEFAMAFEDHKAEAEEKLQAAEAALRAYAESEQRDPSVRDRLIQNVNQAIAEYLKLVEKAEKQED